MTHELTIDRVYTSAVTLHGPVRMLSGYVGVCACGARSELYGITDPIPLWFQWHLDPTGRKARAVQKGVR
jgi:hypothetical protein